MPSWFISSFAVCVCVCVCMCVCVSEVFWIQMQSECLFPDIVQ